MAKKIIYITPGKNDIYPGMSSFESDREGALTKGTQSNLKKILENIVIPEIGAESEMLFRSSGYHNPSWETLNCLCSFLEQSGEYDVNRDILGKMNPWDIESIKKLEEETVVFGLARYEFEKLIKELNNDGYQINDDKSINKDKIYTLTVDVDDKRDVQFNEFSSDEV